MLISVTILWRWNHPATICQHQFVISTRLSPLTPLFLPLWLCTLSCLWLNLTFKGEVIIMSVLKLQTATVFLFKFTPALTQAVEETKRKKQKKTELTQMKWTRRTTRMKNKKLFCLSVSYPTVATMRKPSQPHVVVLRKWIESGLTQATLIWAVNFNNKNVFVERWRLMWRRNSKVTLSLQIVKG